MLNKTLLFWMLPLLLGLAHSVAADPPGSRAALHDSSAALKNNIKTTETHRDWTLHCDTDTCGISTAVKSETGETLFNISVFSSDPPQVVLATPLPLYLPDGLSVAVDPNYSVNLPWFTCTPVGCEIRRELDLALDAAFRAGSGGSVAFTVVDGVKVRLAFSLLGYTSASNALAAISPGSPSP